MPVGFGCPRHVLPCQSPADNCMVVMLDAAPSQPNVIETGSITSLKKTYGRWFTDNTDKQTDSSNMMAERNINPQRQKPYE